MVHDFSDSQKELSLTGCANVGKGGDCVIQRIQQLQGFPSSRELASIIAYRKEPLPSPRSSGSRAKSCHIRRKIEVTVSWYDGARSEGELNSAAHPPSRDVHGDGI